MTDALEAWKARRAKIVGASMSRHRLVKPAAPPPPIALADKFGDLYARTLARHLMAYALECAKARGIREDAPGERAIGGLTFHFADVIQAALTPLAGGLVNEVSDFNKANVGSVFQEIVGIPYTDTPRLETILDGHLTDNVNLIKTMSAEAMGRVRSLVDANIGTNIKDLTKALRAEVGISASHARLIARDQTLKLNGNLTMERHKEAGIERYEWDTSSDERVRKFHKDLNGTQHSWDDPPVIDKKGRKGHPGSDYQCRCTARPIIDLDAIAAKNGVPEIPPTWMDKTHPEFNPDEHKEFANAPVGFLAQWQLKHSAKGVNPFTGPSWFGKLKSEMTGVEKASHATASESLKGAHNAVVETGRRQKLSEAAKRALDTRTAATVQAAREARALISGDTWLEVDGVMVQLKDIPLDKRASAVWINPLTGQRVFPFLYA